jgi:molybdopterin/thiamine biosynthesis adenylyltransferase
MQQTIAGATPTPAAPGAGDASQTWSYDEAFSRNLGWVTADEQRALRAKRVAIAGLGGVGGVQLLTLARLGIGRFHIADFDRFDVVNFNRQSGATVSTLGKPKVDVLGAMARDINPDIELEIFAGGVDEANLDRFLDGVDAYVDGLDFFAFDARERTFAACHAKRVPATTVAPIGMGAALLNFLPGRMTFEDYFCLRGFDESEKIIRFLIGLAPALLHRGYLVDPSHVDFAQHRGPSTAMACQLCAGIAATEVLKIVLRRGRVRAAPVGVQFDAYRNKLVRTWRPGGNRHPLQQAAIAMARRQFAAAARPASDPERR